MKLSIDDVLARVPVQKGCRYFVRHGLHTPLDRGFRSKDEIETWVRTLKLDWRVGYLFVVRGIEGTFTVVTRDGKELRR